MTISASTAARKTTAVAMVLDRSGSMSESRGDSQSKHQSLKEAASIFVDVMVQNDGVGLVRYNQDAQPLAPVAPLGAAGDPFDTTRVNTKNIINGPDLTPSGATSIGDGIFEGRLLLDAASAAYDQKALVVMTDGKENRARFISEVSVQINERTYAVGLGTPEDTSAAALQTLSGSNGGYLLVTGAITADNRFVLQKYFLQILAGISNAEVVLDPDAELVPGRRQRIPFQLTEADAGIDVILLTSYPKAVDFQLQTPNGYLLPPWRAIVEPDMEFTLSQGVAFYRIALPVDLLGDRPEQAGTWHALLTIGSPQLSRPDAPPVVHGRSPFQRLTARELPSRPTLRRGTESDQAVQAFLREQAVRGEHGGRTLPFSLLVHTYSNLSLRASLDQSGYAPGAQVSLRASLSESGIPVLTEAAVWAEITRPDGSIGNVALSLEGDGQFAGTFATSASGVYRCRVRATGRSRAGHPFHREQTLTAPVWRGGDRAPDPGRDGVAPLVRWLEERDEKLCQLLKCLLAERGPISDELEKGLREAGLDLDRMRKCVAVACAQRPDGGSGRDPERDE